MIVCPKDGNKLYKMTEEVLNIDKIKYIKYKL